MAGADAEARTKAQLVIVKGSQLAGALAGGGVGLVGGPVGAVGGAAAGWAVGEVLAGIGLEVMGRMTERAAERTAATVLLIGRDGEEREEQGETRREDGFFDERGALRPEAHELLEAILLTSANAYEERKLPYLAHLYDGVAYDASVRPADALFLAQIAQQLTYRQFQALAVFGAHEKHEMTLAITKTKHDTGDLVPDPALMSELDDIGSRKLVGIEVEGVIEPPTAMVGGNVLSDYPYTNVRLTAGGKTLCRLMRLDRMPDCDQDRWLNELEGAAPRSE